MKKKFNIRNVTMFIFGLVLLEKLYTAPGIVTGTYNSAIMPLLLVLFGLYSILLNCKVNKVNASLSILAIIGVLSSYLHQGGDFRETIRYILLIGITYYAFNVPNVFNRKFSTFVIGSGVIFSVANYMDGNERNTGFLSTSPTLFSLVILICMTKVLFTEESNAYIWPYAALSTILIFLTGSRSTLAVALLFIAIKYLYNIHNEKRMRTKIASISIVVVLISLGVFAIGRFENQTFQRDDAKYSNMTRLAFVEKVYNSMLDNPSSIISGFGPGYSYKITSKYALSKAPLHQDFLTIVCDFGFVGLIVSGLFIFVNRSKWCWQGSVLLIASSFHNILFFPVGLILIISTSAGIALSNTGAKRLRADR